MKTVFTCPLCRQLLEKDNHRYFCTSGHSFDEASEGYANLLLPGQAHSKIPGDNREMVSSRRAFLNAGYYSVFRDKTCELASQLVKNNPAEVAIDAGCGEGYYTSALAETLSTAGYQLYAFDISKYAIKYAAKAYKGINFAVASCANMPFANENAQLLINIFAPLEINETRRVLMPGGYLLYAVPTPQHLFGLKSVLYDEPYLNNREDLKYSGFEFVSRETVNYTIIMTSHTDIMNLFSMTPYYWRSPHEGTKRLEALETLETEIGFDFLIYRKTGGL